MIQFDAARHAGRGLPVFRIQRGTKDRIVDKDWARGGATREPMDAHDRFVGGSYNIGLVTTGFLALDFDAHKGGLDTLSELAPLLPQTYVQSTPNGGEHWVYKCPDGVEVANSVELIGKGTDVRGQNGYILGAGSEYNGKLYEVVCEAPVAEAPRWLIDRAQAAPKKDGTAARVVGELDTPAAIESARDYLRHAHVSISGSGGNNTLYVVAASVITRGCSIDKTVELLLEDWNERCDPPWSPEELTRTVSNAWHYKQSAAGRDNPTGGLVPIDPADVPIVTSLAWPILIGKDNRPDPKHISNYVRLLERMSVEARFNLFSEEIELEGLAHIRILNDAALNQFYAYAHTVGFRPNKQDIFDLIDVIARRNRYHPVLDYLERTRWDNEKRLDTWLLKYMGAEDTPLIREYGRVTLLGAILRVLRPGHKHDTALVLEGEQGGGKSTAAQILGGDWFGDGLRLGADSKVTIEQTRNKWIIEVPELSGMASRDVEQIKAQITTQTDRARLSYARTAIEVARQFTIICTTNDDKYLKDATGNRRFLPVKVGKIDLAALKRDVDQLWAEAYSRAREGESSAVRPEFWAEAALAQERRMVSDAIQERLEELLEGKSGVIEKVDVWRAITGRSDLPTPAEAVRITRAMKALGWKPDRRRKLKSGRPHCFSKDVPADATGHWLTWDGNRFINECEVGPLRPPRPD